MLSSGIVVRPTIDEHHWIFPKRGYRDGDIATRFRDLPCFRSSTSREVHVAFHNSFNPPRRPSRETMERFIQRHDKKQCACYAADEDLLTRVQVLGIKGPGVPAESTCSALFIRMDRDVARFLRKIYDFPYRLPQTQWTSRLESNHWAGRCSCSQGSQLWTPAFAG